ncbi:hypothetical protein NQZ68_016262 [Dissostichus eleginoides]|nr:hypothetical protein NQZ68_016262 [Dissostichus eleginoides]
MESEADRRRRATDSCMLHCKTQWLHERESLTQTDKHRERERGSDFPGSRSSSVKRSDRAVKTLQRKKLSEAAEHWGGLNEPNS